MRITAHLAKNFTVFLISLCIAIGFAQAPVSRTLENGLRAAIAQISTNEASGKLHIVEVDAQSVAAAKSWPWTRDHYARLIRQLDAAGARSIVFDIAFSSPSSPEGDAAFAQAIAEIDTPVMLPTFTQGATENSRRRLDDLPIPMFRENVSLVSASVLPDTDARVRRMVFGTVTDGLPRPSMSAQIAGVSGAAHTSFPIDYSIDPASIPRHSFAAVENGAFDKASVAGRNIIVGATAVELGDRYGVPIHGVIPGVTIQALAAETLLAGAPLEFGWIPLVLLALPLAYMMAQTRNYGQVGLALAGSFAFVIGLQAFAYHGGRIFADGVPALVLLAVVGLSQVLRIARVQLREKALTDSESGLPNALAFANASHADGQWVATAFVKQFDSIQSVLGKEEIGRFVRRLAERIQTVTGVQTVYRADTRMIAWVHEGEHGALIDQFTRIEKALLKPLEIAGRRVDVGVCFGIASENNLAAASRAASEAQSQGKLWHAHEDAEAAMVEQRVSLMGELDDAIEAGHISVVYQPKLRLSTDRVESVEALVRWHHPERGFLRPDHFIPLAEESNRIEPLTLYVLRKTIEDLRDWCEKGAIISAAVNISAKLISSDSFMSAAERIVRATGVPRDRLIFEVTESATMSDPETAVRNLERFRELGIAISMDDYGTGQSTLSYLQLLPLTELKIDRAFVEHAHVERSDALLVRSTIQLAHSLGLRVVGEGVEVAECLDFLREAGCDYVQGYFVSKPISAEELFPLLTIADEAQTPREAEQAS